MEVKDDDTDTAQAGDNNDGGDNNGDNNDGGEAPGVGEAIAGGEAVAGGDFLLFLSLLDRAGLPLFLLSAAALAFTCDPCLHPFFF